MWAKERTHTHTHAPNERQRRNILFYYFVFIFFLLAFLLTAFEYMIVSSGDLRERSREGKENKKLKYMFNATHSHIIRSHFDISPLNNFWNSIQNNNNFDEMNYFFFFSSLSSSFRICKLNRFIRRFVCASSNANAIGILVSFIRLTHKCQIASISFNRQSIEFVRVLCIHMDMATHTCCSLRCGGVIGGV